ncbi:MAG: YidC/Oxa1 family membrane protein insertase [bacterium]|nr:YidC/Oxa1 family membrane protein insertase [bacterium]
MNPLEWFGTYVFNPVIFHPIINILIIFYKGLLFIKVPGAFGLAIIGLTVLVRLILHPFFKQQLETAKKMADMKPTLDKLQAKYKKEPQKLQQEQLKLYQQAGINPASGCLFMIIQIPVFIGLYNALSLFLLNGHAAKTIAQINSMLYWPALKIQTIDPSFFGFNLITSPQKSGLWYYYLIPVITGILQYLQVQATMPATPSTLPVVTTDEKGNKKENSNSGDFQKAMNTQMKYIFPLMIGWFAFTLPIGLSLYWNIFSLFSIIQYKRMNSKK